MAKEITAENALKKHMTVEGLNKPIGTAINSRGQIVVAENGGDCISILTPGGEKITTFCTHGSGNGQLYNPWGVTVDKNDSIYVVEKSNHRLQKFTSEGRFVATVGNKGSNHLQFNDPVGICYNDKTSSLYVCEEGNHRIQVLSTDFRFKSSFGILGSGDGQFEHPQYIALDNSSNLYVTDYDNHRVQVFTAEGEFLRAFPNKANGENLRYPFAIAIDSSNTVYVSEDGPKLNCKDGPNCVSVFTSQGDYMTSFDKQGTRERQFNRIYGLAIDRNDSIIVSDFYNKQLQIF